MNVNTEIVYFKTVIEELSGSNTNMLKCYIWKHGRELIKGVSSESSHCQLMTSKWCTINQALGHMRSGVEPTH